MKGGFGKSETRDYYHFLNKPPGDSFILLYLFSKLFRELGGLSRLFQGFPPGKKYVRLRKGVSKASTPGGSGYDF